MTTLPSNIDNSRQQVATVPEGDPSITGNYRDAALQPGKNPGLAELLKRIDAEVGKSLTAESAALLKYKLQTHGKENFSITVEQGLKALEIARNSNDPEYIRLLTGVVLLCWKRLQTGRPLLRTPGNGIHLTIRPNIGRSLILQQLNMVRPFQEDGSRLPHSVTM